MQILRQLFTVTDADGYVPKSFLQPGDTPVEDDPNSDSDDEIMDTNNGHTERERTYKQEPVPVTNLRDTYGTDPDDTPKAWRYGADALESRDFSIEHPLERCPTSSSHGASRCRSRPRSPRRTPLSIPPQEKRWCWQQSRQTTTLASTASL